MPPAGFEPTISAGERPQTYALDRTATGTGKLIKYIIKIMSLYAVFSCKYSEKVFSNFFHSNIYGMSPDATVLKFSSHDDRWLSVPL